MHKHSVSTLDALRAIGKIVRKERTRKNISQEKFAELAEVHRNYVGRVERAEINLSFDALQRIAGALGWSVAELCQRAGV